MIFERERGTKERELRRYIQWYLGEEASGKRELFLGDGSGGGEQDLPKRLLQQEND